VVLAREEGGSRELLVWPASFARRPETGVVAGAGAGAARAKGITPDFFGAV